MNRYRTMVVALGASLIFGCANSGPNPGAAIGTQRHLIQPHVVQYGDPPDWVFFNIYNPVSSIPTGITVGPNKDIWFVEQAGQNLVDMTMGGYSINYPLGSASSPQDVVTGSDGNLYITDAGSNQIIRSDVNGNLTFFPVTTGNNLQGIALGSDGNVWFAANSVIGELTTGGVLTTYTVPTSNAFLNSIASGSDGNLWFTESGPNKIGKIVPATHVFTEYPVSGCSPGSITGGPDGNLWSLCGQFIDKITTGGVITSYSISHAPFEAPNAITSGPDGALWWTDESANSVNRTTTSGVTTYHQPTIGFNSLPFNIVAGPDGNLWFSSTLGAIGVRVLQIMTVTPNGWITTGPGHTQNVTVSELNHTGGWTGSSDNPGVVTITQSLALGQFVLRSVGHGKTIVQISDAVGNFALIYVTVN
jgi:virginiamycin B lyase